METTQKLKFAIVSGTNREGAISLRLAKAIQKLPELRDTDVQLLDLAQLPPEVYLSTSYDKKPEGLKFWQDTLDYSHGIIFCIPEYNASIPGILKHFIDVLRYPDSFQNKPVALIGLTASENAKSGALAAMSSLMAFLKAQLHDKQVFVTRCRGAVSETGVITDAKTQYLLSQQLNGFVQACQLSQLIVSP